MLLYFDYMRTPKYYQIALELFWLHKNSCIPSDCFGDFSGYDWWSSNALILAVDNVVSILRHAQLDCL